MPEVDAEQRHLRRAGQLGGAQQRAVPAEREHDLRALRGARARPPRHAGQVELVDLLGHDPYLEARLEQVTGHRAGVLGAVPIARSSAATINEAASFHTSTW